MSKSRVNYNGEWLSLEEADNKIFREFALKNNIEELSQAIKYLEKAIEIINKVIIDLKINAEEINKR
mgnify:FL=1